LAQNDHKEHIERARRADAGLLERICAQVDASVSDVLRVLEATHKRIVVIIDSERRVRGVCTDGDVRRGLLRGVGLNAPAISVMNATPVLAEQGEPRSQMLARMRRLGLLHMPVIDPAGRLADLVMTPDGASEPVRSPVLIMAGGAGRRLRPLTQDTPKPMLRLDGRPLLEHTLVSLRLLGFRDFFISVNYLGHVIEDYFGTGAHWGVRITYIRENRALGTGGALGLLPQDIDTPLVMVNGDVLTELDFRDLIATHKENGFAATMRVRNHTTSIPFGVVRRRGLAFQAIEEKPTLTHSVNAGVYCFSPEVLARAPRGAAFDVPDFFLELARAGLTCGVHEVSDAWLDIGTIAEYERAKARFSDGARSASVAIMPAPAANA